MRDGDELVGVRHASGSDDILMVSRKGQAIRFHETDVRPMGRDASGVQGMRLRTDDEVIAVNIAHNDADVLVVTENGYGKRTSVRSEEHTSELQSHSDLVCRLLLEKKKKTKIERR